MKNSNTFFKKQTPVSFIKADIVAKYFYAWAKILTTKMKVPKLAFIDLFAGPGRYEDESESTPILVTKRVILNKGFSDKVQLLFNDKNRANINKLKVEISKLENVDKLKFEPIFRNKTVTLEIIEKLYSWIHPALFFIDPCGYKGFSLDSILKLIEPKGSECIFFFNYNRINAAVTNSVLEKNMVELFGEYFFKELKAKVEIAMGAQNREEIITTEIWNYFSKKYSHIVGFLFKDSYGNKTSHILIHVCTHPLGFKLMKDIMKNYEHISGEDKAIYKYAPWQQGQESLFTDNLQKLKEDLLKVYKGQKIIFQDLFHAHNIGKSYSETDYKEAIKNLELDGKIECEPPYEERKKNTINNKVLLYFK
ncbi:MAG: three-Cys-motif partner protein TcmP [Ignavibacteria bacterium]|nr:three-Cys-motif partner protein TcmP [Ignavibacteria bacterium]